MLNLGRRSLGRGLEAKASCVTLAPHTIRKRRKSSAFDATLWPALSGIISYLNSQPFSYFAKVSTDRGLGSLE